MRAGARRAPKRYFLNPSRCVCRGMTVACENTLAMSVLAALSPPFAKAFLHTPKQCCPPGPPAPSPQQASKVVFCSACCPPSPLVTHPLHAPTLCSSFVPLSLDDRSARWCAVHAA